MNSNNRRSASKRKIVRWVALLFLILGAVGWFIPLFGLVDSPRIELPNTRPQGLRVDEDGNIFCGSGTYERIQMYDRAAKFARAFDVDIGKGRASLFTFEIKERQLYIHVFGVWLRSERLDRKIVYGLDGSLLSVTDVPSTEYSGYCVNNQASDSSGNTYILKGFLWPRVVKETNGDRTVIIKTPLYLWFLQAPFPAFAFFFGGLLFLVDFRSIVRH